MAPADSIGAWQIHNLQHLEKYAGNYPLIHKTIATCSQISIGLSAFPPTSKEKTNPPHQNQKHFPPQLSKTQENPRISLDFHHFSAVGTIPWAQLGWFHLAAGRFLRLRCCLRRLRRRCRRLRCLRRRRWGRHRRGGCGRGSRRHGRCGGGAPWVLGMFDSSCYSQKIWTVCNYRNIYS